MPATILSVVDPRRDIPLNLFCPTDILAMPRLIIATQDISNIITSTSDQTIEHR
jgi:hypothetical protein